MHIKPDLRYVLLFLSVRKFVRLRLRLILWFCLLFDIAPSFVVWDRLGAFLVNEIFVSSCAS